MVARIYGNLPTISREVKSFDSFVALMGEGKGQILTNTFLIFAIHFKLASRAPTTKEG
jgi:hypothetical protein